MTTQQVTRHFRLLVSPRSQNGGVLEIVAFRNNTKGV
jgi:hypothetical protein